MPYLGNLTLRLSAGAMCLPEPVRRRHAEFLAAAQGDDGGFAGREGPSDLYYTGFGLRGLAILGGLSEAVALRAAGFLARHLEKSLPPVDFLSLVLSAVLLEMITGDDVFGSVGRDLRQVLVERTEPSRRDDGGFAKSPRSGPSSTYHTFLVAACRQLVGVSLPEPERMARLARTRQRPDGGFVELAGLEHSGTSPTAAAVGLLRLLDAVDDRVRVTSSGFLASMQNPEGGLRANTRIPVADLLSTFVGLAALDDMESLSEVDAAAVRRYVQSLEVAEGGFLGGAWDDRPDVEYTFYGLGALALLAA